MRPTQNIVAIIALLATSAGAIQIISVTNGQPEGNWGMLEACPGNSKAVGYQTQNDLVALPLYDKTAMNSIRLFCSDGTNVTSATGHAGTWELRQNCPDGKFLSGFRLLVEAFDPNSSDNTAVNSIQFVCTDETELNYNGNTAGVWGDYSSPDCSTSGICGIQTRVKPNGGALVDNTSLNDVIFVCC